ncbi:hypothetical protein BBK82_30540 [Lentzea guizhouensis]|uniref:Phosphatidic acid phosphatase type 2/haloperoxidase domain-containing protein n=1 Tax=Lentzea guizhouensis TaxID=1586287 RepID=A0A1B2HPS8_9PSEU|nr:phosphatase PAP2 family protein [Lentzea guizhouensis]ANZ39737.1 hypothetical protein BBK82_30540 [Lentzea guizhouensis]
MTGGPVRWFLLGWLGVHVLASAFVLLADDDATSEGLCRAGLGEVARALSALGNPMPVTVLAAASAVAALVLRRWWAAVVLVVVPYLATYTTGLLKNAFTRPRPVFECVAGGEFGFSFPSGHAVGATTGFVLVAVWVASLLPQRFTLAVCIPAAVLAGAVAWSRVALGAHYATDVVAGLVWGTLWVMLGAGLLVVGKKMPQNAVESL